MGKSNYQFRGYDWTELADCWGIKVDDEFLNGYEVDEQLSKKISDYMYHNLHDTQMIDDLRRFIDTLCHMGEKYGLPDYPIWRGMKETKKNDTLIAYVSDTMRRLWT